jgi:O-antigen ligase
MESKADQRYLGLYVLGSSIAVSLFISPGSSIDPMNLPKLFLLSILGFLAGGFAIARVDFFKDRKSRPFLVLTSLFFFQLLIVFAFDNRDFAFKFYGTSGRNTGTLAYIALTLLLLASTVSASRRVLQRYSVSLVAVGFILGLYGILQSRGVDFYEFNNAYATNVFGTFGNPNFQSAFMGITGTVALTCVCFSHVRLEIKLGLIVFVGLAVYNIFLSSEQGYLILLAGFTSAVVIFLLSIKQKILGYSVLGLGGIAGLLVLVGIFNKGPLAEVIYKSSLQARSFYWEAAIRMMIDHPFFGVGMDGFGDWYRRSRTQEIADFNPGIAADTAHNIPLDIGSGGGIPLLLVYLSLVGLALISIVKILKRTTSFDLVFTSVAAAWFAYQAQSLISINQIGIGVWGWSLTGLLIGYELHTRSSEKDSQSKVQRKVIKKQQISALAVVTSFIFGGLGLAAAIPPYSAAGKFYKALQSGDAQVIQPAAYLQPKDRARYLHVARIMIENKLDDRAIKVLSDASLIYPDSFDLWQTWANVPTATPDQISRAKSEMRRLDPYNKEIK